MEDIKILNSGVIIYFDIEENEYKLKGVDKEGG